MYNLESRLFTEAAEFRILWVSRKYHERAESLSGFAQGRKITNEASTLQAIYKKLNEYCNIGRDCTFIRDRSLSVSPSRKQVIAWEVIDPTVIGLRSQIELFGNADLVIGVHGGALGMTMFCEPGAHVALIELQPPAARGNYHFHNIAHMTGRRYTALNVGQQLSVDDVWGSIENPSPRL